MSTPERPEMQEIDSSELDLVWSAGIVHLRVHGQEVATMSPEVAARLSVMARSCLISALSHDAKHTAKAGGWVRELLMTPPAAMDAQEFRRLTGKQP